MKHRIQNGIAVLLLLIGLAGLLEFFSVGGVAILPESCGLHRQTG